MVITKTMAWLIGSVLILALQLGYIHAQSNKAALRPAHKPLAVPLGEDTALSWNVVAITDLGQEIDSRSTADRFVLIRVTITNGGSEIVQYPGFNLLAPDKATIYPHLGNLALDGLCSPQQLGPGETLTCGHVFELREAVKDGVVVMDGNGEAAVVVP